MTIKELIRETEFVNPLEEPALHSKLADPCILVIFGASGDLTGRKLIPALYNLAHDALLPSHFACVGFARRDKSDDDFRNESKKDIDQFSRNKPAEDSLFQTFSQQMFYHKSTFDEDEGYESLKKRLEELDRQLGTKGNRIFYLSTQPSYFTTIIQKLSEHGLIYPRSEKKMFSRVIIEKPFGHDLNSAIDLQEDIVKHLDESQIFRIDHYLGKETVQNLLTFRFSNPIFEDLWNNHFVDNIQITVAEELGIGTRGRFWEEAGMIRDIVQNHVMQLLSITLMEPPVNFNANAIRDEKVKVLESVRPMSDEEIDRFVVRGQYAPGLINGEKVGSYRDEENVDPKSDVETYVAMKLFVDNWRWAGVPIYIRAGKRLTRRSTEIAITFKQAPAIFSESGKPFDPNVLVMHIQPNEGISLKINCKVPGQARVVQPVKMDFQYGSYFGGKPPEAYERLIADCMAGDSTLFARNDEVFASWRIHTPIIERWKKTKPKFPNYAAGSQGPECSDDLLNADDRSWRLV